MKTASLVHLMSLFIATGLSCSNGGAHKGGAQAGSPWPMEGGNARHTGQSSHVGPRTNSVKWSISTEGYVGAGGPVIDADGTIYVGARDVFHAYHPDGSEKWKYSCPASGSSTCQWSTPALGANGVLYVWSSNGEGELCALDTTPRPRSTDQLKWSYPTEDRSGASPIIGMDGTVYIGSRFLENTKGALYAFSAAESSPNPTWIFDSGPVTGSSPAIGSDGTIFVAIETGSLLAIGANGQHSWTSNITGGTKISPVIGADGTVYAGSMNGYLYAIDAKTGAARSFKLSSKIGALAMGTDGALYVGVQEGFLFAIDPATIGQDCKPLWSVKLSQSAASVNHIVIGADGTLYVTSDRLYAIAPHDIATIKWASDEATGPKGPGMSSPAIGADGTLYLMDGGGILYAFGP